MHYPGVLFCRHRDERSTISICSSTVFGENSLVFGVASVVVFAVGVEVVFDVGVVFDVVFGVVVEVMVIYGWW